MARCPLIAPVDDPGRLAAVADAVRDWEPRVVVDYQAAEGMLYDPDATLYALNLGGPCRLSTDRRQLAIARGDLVAVPPGLGIEVDPAGDFLRLLDCGTRPPHFRERFVQVHGFEVLAPDCERPAAASGHRFAHEPVTIAGDAPREIVGDAWEGRLLVGLDGRAVVEGGGPASTGPLGITAGQVAFLGVGSTVRLRGPARLVVVRFAPELFHRTHLRGEVRGS